MRILEATVAVMIVSGVLVVVYSRQVDRGMEPADYFYNLQRQILMDVSSNSLLRLAVLGVDVNDLTDGNFTIINDFVKERIPTAFGYSAKICDLGNICQLDSGIYKETIDKDIFVEEIVISSDLGDGSGNQIYDPKKLILFVWEVR